MGNFKVKVNTPEESKEVQELFFELGLRFVNVDDFEYPQWLAVTKSDGTFSNYSISKNIWYTCNPKETTLAELRAMVVLKRNDVNDATHENSIYKYFKACDDWYYFDLGCTDKWQKSAGAKPEYYEKLKPIEKKEMKEYLQKRPDGTYAHKTGYGEAPEEWIEIPEGAEILAETRNGLVFYKKHGDRFAYCFAGETEWGGTFTNPHDELGAFVSGFVWQREQDDPFLTPECTLNDQYAEIEQVRQTLNERQSQYGEFKDVADTTSVFMGQFALGYMSNVQREALHMICSKLARIANGDPNHVDSWHDIAGYATLVVDDLES